MKTKLHDWKIDEVLQTPEDRAIYIQAATDTHDPAYLAKALGNVSRIEGEERIAKRANQALTGNNQARGARANCRKNSQNKH